MSTLSIPSAAVREAQVRERLDTFGLSQTHFNVLKLYNADQPYHNWHHCAIVALSALQAAEIEHVHLAQQRLLLLAGLYHDYDHTADSSKADVFNIARALSGADFWLRTKEPGLTQAERNEVANMIAATESSHRHVPRSRSECILMDADVLASTQSERELWWTGLGEEFGRPVDCEATLTFLRGQNMHSLWGMQRVKQVIADLERPAPVIGLGE